MSREDSGLVCLTVFRTHYINGGVQTYSGIAAHKISVYQVRQRRIPVSDLRLDIKIDGSYQSRYMDGQNLTVWKFILLTSNIKKQKKPVKMESIKLSIKGNDRKINIAL